MMEDQELTEINWYLLWLIFAAVLLSKLLSTWSSKLCDILTVWYIPEPSKMIDLRTQVTGMKQQLQMINMMDNFAEYAKLKRKVSKIEEEFQVEEHAHRSRLMKNNTLLSMASTVLTLILRMGVVIYNRNKTVAVVPTEMFYPISPILAFPTGQPGGIGCPLWAVACSIAIETAVYWLKALRTSI